MLNFIIFFIFFAADSIQNNSFDSLEVKSIMFQNKAEIEARKIRYQHQQGFFCDFEDRINKNRKINLNIGVGAQ